MAGSPYARMLLYHIHAVIARHVYPARIPDSANYERNNEELHDYEAPHYHPIQPTTITYDPRDFPQGGPPIPPPQLVADGYIPANFAAQKEAGGLSLLCATPVAAHHGLTLPRLHTHVSTTARRCSQVLVVTPFILVLRHT